ncbi:hypothetical protein B4N89_11385 [Embleya scabrispora]|uniref:Uncharacterized protein n=1 Tax=Embleya scabrispora TaxID=159449 RepID=A0A1T3NX83_9ACTN|nr:hypothetical protein [Embleya scabrispora]OPC81469.1 hypothetical protein B4N89_11385 [Embleya scabrispora]
MTVPAVPRGLRSLIPGPGPEAIVDDAGRPAAGSAVAAGPPDGAPPIAARTRSMLDGLAAVPVPRAVAEASADVLCALAASAPAELAQVARELAGRLRAAARTA